jgi:thiol-disulfide isomerase/thioredoxin
MSNRLKTSLAVFALCAAIVAPVRAQDPAPELALPDLGGAEQKLSAYRGKVVLVNFWATWCAPCRKEMPALVKLQDEYGEKGFQVVAVTVDTESFHDKVIAYAKDAKLNFPVWFGSTANLDPFGFGTLLPSTAIVDRDGRIVERIEGVVDEAAVRARLDALVGGS